MSVDTTPGLAQLRPLRKALAPREGVQMQEVPPPRVTALYDLRALARDLLLDGEAVVAELEYGAAAGVVEGARAVLLDVGRRLDLMLRRLREGL